MRIIVKTNEPFARIKYAKIRMSTIQSVFSTWNIVTGRYLPRNGICESGNWTSKFNGPPEADEDFMQEFEIKTYPTEVIDEKMHLLENGQIALECHLFKIQLCMFASRTGKVYRPRISSRTSFPSTRRILRWKTAIGDV